jgi:hypothetical protein
VNINRFILTEYGSQIIKSLSERGWKVEAYFYPDVLETVVTVTRNDHEITASEKTFEGSIIKVFDQVSLYESIIQ